MHEVAPKFKVARFTTKGHFCALPAENAWLARHYRWATAEWGDRRVWLCGQRPVLSVLGNTDHLDAGSIRRLVITANCSFYRAEDFARKLLIHYRNAWRVLVAMPGEMLAGQQRGALRVGRT
jgi:hypothetical protein